MRRSRPYVLLLLLFLCSVSCGIAHAQDWVRQSPFPADNDLRDTFFVSPDVGWVIGADEIALQTIDGGNTWQQASDFVRNPFQNDERLNAVVFVDSQNGFVGGNNIYRTTDGGASWQDMGFHGQVRRMEFISPQIGFITSNSGIRRTNDGGQSFQTIDGNPAHGLDIDFFNENKGVYVSPGVWESVDGGQTWAQISNEVFRLIEYVNEDTLIAAGGPTTRATLNRSTDGGQNWQEVLAVDDLPQNGFTDLARIDSDSIAAIDQNYRIWISDDDGQTWNVRQPAVGNWSGSLPSIHFPSPEVGFVSGGIGLIFKTIDGGHTWTKQNRGGAIALHDIAMDASGLGIAVGAELTVFRTTDFGRHWDVFTIDELSLDTLFKVQVVSLDVIMACGFDSVYRSEDGGKTWFAVESQLPAGFDWNGISFLDPNVGWLFGRGGFDGAIYKTTDGGQSWTEVLARLGNPLGEGEMVSPNFGWVVNFQRHLLTTQNDWSTVTRQELPTSDIFFELDLVDENIGWVIGTFERVAKSTDGGLTFQVQAHPGYDEDEPERDQIEDIFALDADNVYLALRNNYTGQYGTVHHSTDGGDTWTQLNSFGDPSHQFGGRISEITVLPTGEIWAAGISDGFIWASDQPLVTVFADGLQVSKGILAMGGDAELRASDNQDVSIFRNPLEVASAVHLEVEGVSPTASPTQLSFTLESSVFARNQVVQTIDLYNYETDAWEEIASEDAAQFFDSNMVVTPGGDLQRFVQPNTLAVKARCRYESINPRQNFSANVDLVLWGID